MSERVRVLNWSFSTTSLELSNLVKEKIMKHLFRVTSALIFLAFVSTGNATVIIAGIDDNFGGSIETASPSVDLMALLPSAAVGFDGLPHNQQVAHTFTGLPSDIISASIEFRVKGGFNPGVGTDGIFITFANSNSTSLVDEIVWGRTFGDFAGGGTVFSDSDIGIATPGLTWGPNSEAYLTLDLSALPLIDGSTINILSNISSNGFMDVTVSDDSIVDFYRLTLNMTSVPEPGTFFLALLGLAGILTFRGNSRKMLT